MISYIFSSKEGLFCRHSLTLLGYSEFLSISSYAVFLVRIGYLKNKYNKCNVQDFDSGKNFDNPSPLMPVFIVTSLIYLSESENLKSERVQLNGVVFPC